MNDKEIETEILAKDLTAPRVTPTQLENVIVSEQYHIFPDTTFTACLLTLKNGYTVIGESACASPENFDADLGRKIARKNAVNKIWALEGYLLRQMLVEKGDKVMRAKMCITNVDAHDEFEILSMRAVCREDGYGADGLDENNTYSKFTPSADVNINIQNGALFGKFAVGDFYYIDFTRAD